jgi:hypothetical protein
VLRLLCTAGSCGTRHLLYGGVHAYYRRPVNHGAAKQQHSISCMSSALCQGRAVDPTASTHTAAAQAFLKEPCSFSRHAVQIRILV